MNSSKKKGISFILQEKERALEIIQRQNSSLSSSTFEELVTQIEKGENERTNLKNEIEKLMEVLF